MENAPALIAAATVLGGAYLLTRAVAQAGSGGGAVGTDNTFEGSILDLNGLANQVAAAATPAPQDNPQGMSDQGLKALMAREGFSATPYADHKGNSIGFGHLIKPGESLDYVTVQQATDILMSDVAWAVDVVRASIVVPINQSQFDALVSFAYNVGAGAFARSTLVRRINTGDPGAAQEFARWVYASGVVNQALVARRQSERQQFEGATA